MRLHPSRRVLLALFALLTSLALAGALSGSFAATASADPAPGPKLQREGRYLVDDQGRLVIVHGLNFVWKSAPYAPPDTPNGFTQADADWLYDHGFNGARLGILWAG